MPCDIKARSLLYIFAGSILLIWVLGHFVFQVLIAFAGLYLINYGLQLRNKPPLFYLIQTWFDEFRSGMN